MMERIRVLLVDDHPVVRAGLRSILETVGDIEVVGEASDGLKAVELAAQCQPQVVLMDIRMPNMDGLEATRRIKSEFPGIFVILLTMFDDDALVMDAVRAGAGGYLLKDASKELLINAIRAVNSGGMLVKSQLLREVVAGLTHSTIVRVPHSPSEAIEPDILTPRENDVLLLLVEGCTNKEIAKALIISDDTAKKHVQNIIGKLRASDRTQAAVYAVRAGLVD